MKLSALPLLCDENIHPDVIRALRGAGSNVATVHELGLAGASDASILTEAGRSQRAVLTHDSDFGTLAIAAGQLILGVVYLRPGHIRADFTIATVQELLRADPEITPPFILVAVRSGDRLRIRIRSLDATA